MFTARTAARAVTPRSGGDEKFVSYKPCNHPDSVDRVYPPLRMAGSREYPRVTYVLHKPCHHPDSAARRPPLEKGGLGGVIPA